MFNLCVYVLLIELTRTDCKYSYGVCHRLPFTRLQQTDKVQCIYMVRFKRQKSLV